MIDQAMMDALKQTRIVTREHRNDRSLDFGAKHVRKVLTNSNN